MRAFVRKSKAAQQITPSEFTIAGRAHMRRSREVDSSLHLPGTMATRAIQRSSEANTTGGTRSGQDFGRIPVSAADGANDAEHTARGPVPIAHDFAKLRIFPIQAPLARSASHVDIPTSGEPGEIVDEPPARGGAPAGGPAPNTLESCGQPRSMHKLTSGAFLGGLTMDSYYRDLTGRGFYDHPDKGGTFDTGSQAGANMQLYGVIPSPCLPTQFHLEQTITRTRYRINGVARPEEGRTYDDLAKSGRDVSRPPFRQEFLGGGTAPLGYIISMADPPSTGYDSTSNIEHDRDFVTSLVGPSGRQSVSWSLSTRISGGTVTSNTLT
jgi:hypothetical protein